MVSDRGGLDACLPESFLSEGCLVVFAKPAVPGRVKTRLIGDLTARQAASLHAAFVGDSLAALSGADCELRVAWAVEAEEPLPDCEVAGFRQRGADLGERLYRALRQAAADHPRVAAIGSDHPDLPVALVNQAFARLGVEGRAVLGPADDGGYYLIALRAGDVSRELFDGIDWSTAAVLEQTVERCRRGGLEASLLEPWSDVDRPADLERLVAALAGGSAHCPRTRELLASWGRL